MVGLVLEAPIPGVEVAEVAAVVVADADIKNHQEHCLKSSQKSEQGKT